MGKITVSVDLNVSIDKVWDIISDLDNEPKFWKGTKEIRNISSNENIVKREVTIAFRDQKCMQEVTILPKQKIEAKFSSIAYIICAFIIQTEVFKNIRFFSVKGAFYNYVDKMLAVLTTYPLR